MASRKSVAWITLPAWHCRICGSVPVLWQVRNVWGREGFSELHGVKQSAARLRGTPCDSEFANSLLEGGALHSKMCCRPVRASHDPVAMLQGFEDVLTF
jgi:hypothetical protein